ncbi:hypothetical protein [Bacillus toyonensis]|uniref:hypothetical protein n=1 Tax=Bacillus toyonensis TaxID=155322 RepID=UPI0009A739E6|nr:hypothetical protein [Bacillus toyonensis]SLK20408.1 hypothetical protein SAMN05880553_5340 [Bacillus toyonensis]
MGIKMSSAYHPFLNRIVGIDEIQKNEVLQTDLYCIDENCRKQLSFVDEFERKYNDKTITVRAFLRLAGKEKHIEACQFNTAGQVKVIARSAEDLMTSLENGKYEFRLHVIKKALQKKKNSATASDVLVTPGATPRNPQRVYENKGKLSSYLESMKKIMQLRTQLEDQDKELRNLVVLKFHNKKIEWNKFFYDTDNFRGAFDYLSTSPDHPICLHGRIKSINTPTEKFPYHSILLSSPWIEKADKDNIKRIPSVSIVIYNKSLVEGVMQKFEEGINNIAVFSDINCKTSEIIKDDKKQEKLQYLNMQGKLNRQKQIHMY